MLKKTIIKKQRGVRVLVKNEAMSKSNESFGDSNLTGIKDSAKAGTYQMPFEILSQIMRAYSNFLANGTIKSKSI